MVKQIDYIADQRLNKLEPWLEYTLGAEPSPGVANQHHHGARRSPIAVVGAMPGYVTLKHDSVNLNLGSLKLKPGTLEFVTGFRISGLVL